MITCPIKKARAKLEKRHYAALRRALEKAPRWIDKEEIKAFYVACPDGHEIDHIIPCNSPIVSGLHVIENLQYLPKSDNKKKLNKYNIPH